MENLKTIKLDIVTAYNEKNEALILTDKISTDGTLNWKPTSGKWTVFAIKVVLYTKIEQVLRMTNVFGSFG